MNLKKIAYVFIASIVSINTFAANPAHCLRPDQLRFTAMQHKIYDIMTVKHNRDIHFFKWYTVGSMPYHAIVNILLNANNTWTAGYGDENDYGLMCGYRSTMQSHDSDTVIYLQKYYKNPL